MLCPRIVLAGFNHTCCGFHLSWSHYPRQEKQHSERLADPTYRDVSWSPWSLPVCAVVLVAGTGGKLKQLWVRVLVSPLCSSACAWPVLAACDLCCSSLPVQLPGWQFLGDAPGAQILGSSALFWTRLCLSCALTRGHCATCRSLINNLLTCLAALCSVACFTTLPGVLECWFPWQPDIAFLFFITITVLLLPCSNALSSLFCLGVCVRATNLFLKIILLNHLVNLEKGWWSVTVDLILNGEARHKWKQARKKNKLATQILIQTA